jgi:hypothetical protein
LRADFGFLAFDGVLVAVGASLLHAIGLAPRSLRRWPLAVGPAFLAGICLVIPLLIALLTIGVHATLPAFLLVSALLIALLLGVARPRIATQGSRDGPIAWHSSLDRWLAVGTMIFMAVYAVAAAHVFSDVPAVLDNANIWSLKALSLFDFGGLQPGVFDNQAYVASHLDYPLLQPLLASLHYRFANGPQIGQFNVQLWLIFAAGCWSALYILKSNRAAPYFVVACLLVTESAWSQVALGYADITLASLLAPGVLSLGRWLETGQRRYGLLGVVLLAGAANTKNEGLVYAALAVLVIGLGAFFRIGWRRLGWHVAALAVVIVAALPWRLWALAHHLTDTEFPPLHTVLSPSYLFDRVHRARLAIDSIFEYLTRTGSWHFLAPAFVAIVLVGLTRSRSRILAAAYAGIVVLCFFVLVGVYWASSIEIRFYLDTSAVRTVDPLVFLGAVAVAHLMTLQDFGWGSVRADPEGDRECPQSVEAAPELVSRSEGSGTALS